MRKPYIGNRYIQNIGIPIQVHRGTFFVTHLYFSRNSLKGTRLDVTKVDTKVDTNFCINK